MSFQICPVIAQIGFLMLWILLLTNGWVGQSVCQQIESSTFGNIISKDDLRMTGQIGSAMPKTSMLLTISQLQFHVDDVAAELGQLQHQKSITASFLQPIVLKSVVLTLAVGMNEEENIDIEISAWNGNCRVSHSKEYTAG